MIAIGIDARISVIGIAASSVVAPRVRAVFAHAGVVFSPARLDFAHTHAPAHDEPGDGGRLPSVRQTQRAAFRNATSLALSFALRAARMIKGREPLDPKALSAALLDLAQQEESFFRDLKTAVR